MLKYFKVATYFLVLYVNLNYLNPDPPENIILNKCLFLLVPVGVHLSQISHFIFFNFETCYNNFWGLMQRFFNLLPTLKAHFCKKRKKNENAAF